MVADIISAKASAAGKTQISIQAIPKASIAAFILNVLTRFTSWCHSMKNTEASKNQLFTPLGQIVPTICSCGLPASHTPNHTQSPQALCGFDVSRELPVNPSGGKPSAVRPAPGETRHQLEAQSVLR
jgi:hypothetical protein